MNFQYKNLNEKNDTLNEEFMDMDENEDNGFVEDYADHMKDEWDQYDDGDEGDNEGDEEYENDNYDDEDEWFSGVEDDDDYFVDNLGELSNDSQGSQDNIFKARNHYEAMVRPFIIHNLVIIYIYIYIMLYIKYIFLRPNTLK